MPVTPPTGDSPLSIPTPLYTGTAQSPLKPEERVTPDSMSSTTTSYDGCLAQLWNAICNFFKSICPCLFGRKEQTPQPTRTDSSSIQPAPKAEPSSVQQPKNTQPEPSSLETAQTELLKWWNERDEGDHFKNRDGDIDPALVARLQNAAKEPAVFPEKIVLFCQRFKLGFPFFYAAAVADLGKDEYYLPIGRDLGLLLGKAKDKNIVLPWTLTDPLDKKPIVVQVETCQSLPPQVENVKDYLDTLLNNAFSQFNKIVWSKDMRILQALIPYAHAIKEELGPEQYSRLKGFIPAYPENPQ